MNDTQELALVPSEDHARIETLQRVDNPWAEFETQIAPLETTAGTIVVTKENYLVQSSIARTIRLQARATRVAIEHRREELVKDLNERTKSINGAARILKERLEEMEGKLLEQEKFAERETARIKAELSTNRGEALSPFGVDPSFYSLGDMPDPVWQQLLENSRLAHESKLEAARKAEEQRISDENARLLREKAEAEERERAKAENARLKKEADDRLRAEVEENRRRKELHESRAEELESIGLDADTLALADMTCEEFALFVLDSRAAYQERLKEAIERDRLEKLADEQEAAAKIEREAFTAKLLEQQQKADRERREQEEAALKERERIQAEADAERDRIVSTAKKEREAASEKLRKQQAEARKKQAAADAKATLEREAREKLERENAERFAKEKAETERIEAEKVAAAKAPDREKLIAFAKSLEALELPTMATEAGNLAHDKIDHQISQLAKWIVKTAEAM